MYKLNVHESCMFQDSVLEHAWNREVLGRHVTGLVVSMHGIGAVALVYSTCISQCMVQAYSQCVIHMHLALADYGTYFLKILPQRDFISRMCLMW